MNKKNNLKVLKFPNKLNEIEKKVEAILFSAAEPLDIEAIKDKVKTRTDLQCVMHSHSRAGLAVSCLKNGLEILIQDSAMFYNKISYHNWEGMSTSTEECKSISDDLGKNNAMILRNHGLLTSGKSISEAFMMMYYLDRACKVQIDLSLINKEIIKPSNNLLEFAAGQYEDPNFKLGVNEWPALKRMLKKNNSIYDQ